MRSSDCAICGEPAGPNGDVRYLWGRLVLVCAHCLCVRLQEDGRILAVKLG